MEPDILPRAPRHQRIAFLVLGGLAGLTIALGQKAFWGWAGAHLTPFQFFLLPGVLLLPLGLWILSIGLRMILQEQAPLPGTFVLKDTPILRGGAAKRRGWFHVLGGIALLCCAAAFAGLAFKYGRPAMAQVRVRPH
jgi:hypothetical protein